MRSCLAPLASVALVCLAVMPASAQDASTSTEAPPAHVSFVDGAVVLERDGRSDSSPSSMPLLAGDRIRTQSGRAEVLFADGSALHVDQHSVLDVQSDEVVRLLEGRMRLSIAPLEGGQSRGVVYRVDGPAAWVQIEEAGEYRITILRGDQEPRVELAVLRGAAELVNEDGRSLVRAGERAFARAGAQPSAPYVFNSASWDAFDRWSEARRDQRLGTSAQYLPSDVRPYAATFDNYGSWRYEQVHGYVWYPRVRTDWRPYYHGRWASLRPYGWTWIAGDPWGWPTHHYGRWGYSSNAWFWIPGRRWGAAWVSWAYAPDYVSWCPLGWNDRPVFSFININVNVFGRRHYDPWRAWTVVPQRHFGYGYVNAHVVAAGRLDHRVRGSFVVRDRGPEWRHAVPRASAPIRAAGTRPGYAVPRGSGNASAPYASRGNRSESRGFPAPARAPRSPDADVRSSTRSSTRSSAPITAAPDRAVPRRGSGIDAGRADRTPRGDRSPSTDWRRSDRSAERVSPGSAPQQTEQPRWRTPESRPDNGARPDSGYRRAPDRGYSSDRNDSNERSRAVPRQDSPRPSYEAPRENSRSAPRSYGSPERQSPSSQPRSADRPSRSGSGDGGARSRGDRPSSGQATRRPRG